MSGRFGLRATPGGIGTPAFGPSDALEVVRTSGGLLVHELGTQLRSVPMAGATLAELAAVVEVDLQAPFAAGTDTPDVGDVDAPLRLDAGVLTALAAWYDLGWRALDEIGPTAGGTGTDPAVARALRRQLPGLRRPRPRRPLRPRRLAR